jgi:ATP-dependent DNA ligase
MDAPVASIVPRGPSWVHELRRAGWRMIARIAGADVRLTTRHGRDYADAMKQIAAALRALRAATQSSMASLACPTPQNHGYPWRRRPG